MKRIVIVLLFVLPVLQMRAQEIKAGPWVSGVRGNTITVLWTSEKPGMAWVELEDGTLKYETYAFQRHPHAHP